MVKGMLLAVRIPLISDHDQFVARLFRVQVNLEGVVPHRRVKEALQASRRRPRRAIQT
jgi:hypothetical protein